MYEPIVSVIAGEREFHIQKMSAAEQESVLNTFMKYGLTDALFYMSTGQNHLMGSAFFGKFAAEAPEDVKAKIEKTLLMGCTEKGKDRPISASDFQDQQFTRIQLIIEALKANYADFLPLLQAPGAEETPQTEQNEMSTL